MGQELFNIFLENSSTYFLVFVRLGTFIALLPGFGEESLPTRIKVFLAVGASLIVAPGVDNYAALMPFSQSIVVEVLNGFTLGIGFRLFVICLQVAGVIAAQSTSLSQLVGAQSAEPLPAIGHILLISGLALFLLSGLHLAALGLFYKSFVLAPLGHLILTGSTSEWGVGLVSATFNLAFSIATPFIVASVIYNLALGAINRAMPQLMVVFVGAPLITFGGIVVLMIAIPLMMESWLIELRQFVTDTLRLR